MSPRFRRYLLRCLPVLVALLAFSWLINRFFGGGFDSGFAICLWVVILVGKWIVRLEPDQRD